MLDLGSLVGRIAGSRSLHLSFGRYLAIGCTVFAVDLLTFQLLMRAHVLLTIATSASYFAGVIVHFCLNKYVTFRSHTRAIHIQARTYTAVVALSWLLTLATVELFAHAGAPPIEGKFTAIVIALPYGYICHRYLTFGPGATATLRKLLKHAFGRR